MNDPGSHIQKLFTSRDRNTAEVDQEDGPLGNTYVGEIGRLWYNPDSNCVYVSDGETPGGIPINCCGFVNANISVRDEGVLLTNNVSSFNFVGNGVVATNVGRAVTVTIPGSDLTGLTTYDEGNLLTVNTQSLNFVGNSITATNVGNAVTVTVSDAGSIANLYNGSFYADGTTTLTAGFNSNSTLPIAVASTAGFYSSGYIRIDGEVIKYTGKTATTFTGITRGQAGSTGSSHASGDGVGAAQVTTAGAVANVLIESTSYSTGVSLDAATGIVTVANSGRYNLQFSVQVECYDNAPADTAIWFAQNGNSIPTSASYATTPQIHGGEPGASIITVNIFTDCAANDTLQLKWTSITGKTAITTVPPVGGTIPTSPGVIFTVNRIY